MVYTTGPGRGRPRRLTPEQEHEIKSVVLEGPDLEKDGQSAFTLEDIRKIIEDRYVANYHIGYMGRLMRRLDLSRQKARPSHPKKDPAAAAAFKKSPTNSVKACRYTRRRG